MKAVYLKSPNQFQVRQVTLREPGPEEVWVQVGACGFCGSDKTQAAVGAPDYEPFGHEFAGIVEKCGSNVKNVKVGDRVVIETSTFHPLEPASLNGHPELSQGGQTYMDLPQTAMGFAERTIVPAVLCYPFDGIPDEEACFLEPMGVAADLVLTADVKLGNDVLVMGCGAIGLMALQMAKASGARKIYAAEHSRNRRKAELAKEFGADEVILTDETDLTKFPFARGGVDRVLITTPPKTIPQATQVCNLGGILAFLGMARGENAKFTLDANVVQRRKLQLRASFAFPALYFPQCMELLQAGTVQVRPMISHRFPLERAPECLQAYLYEKETAVKAVMVTDTAVV